MFAQLNFTLKRVVVIGVGVCILGGSTFLVRWLGPPSGDDLVYQADGQVAGALGGEGKGGQAGQEGQAGSAGQAKLQIAVHVGGAVDKPDVYLVDVDARVNEVVQLAGPSEDAYLDGLNLAMTVQDGQKISVPSQSAYEDSNLINLNQASKADLKTLPGIGEVTAQKIISHRERYGTFYALEDLLRIEGIGEAKVEAIRDLASVY